MPARTKFALVALLLAWCSFGSAEKIADIRPHGYVTDLARVIDPATKTKLEMLCTEVEQKTGAQIAVVTVNSLDGQSREDYSADLYKHLGVGSKKNDRGVLLLVAPKERQYKIEVGYGLEPVINDARAGEIGREMVLDLHRGDYSAAVLLGTTRLAQLIAADKGVRLNGVPAKRPRASASPDWRINSPLIPVLVVVSVFVILGIISRLLGQGPRWRPPPQIDGGGSWGGGFGGSSGGYSGGGGSGGFGGFGGGSSGGGGAGGSW